MRNLRYPVAYLVLLAVMAGPAAAGEPSEAEIKAWVAELGQSDAAAREAARQKLLQAGARALPYVQAARQDATLLWLVLRLSPAAHVLGTRTLDRRVEMLNLHGGSTGTEQAVTAGLKWLELHQDSDGGWSGTRFRASCDCQGEGKLTWIDPGLTGLALLAFLGAGNLPVAGPYQATVNSGLGYLLKHQAADGLIGGKHGNYMYNHAIAALALVEAYAMTKSPELRAAAAKAVAYLVKARNPRHAWRYTERDGDNDMSVTGWCVMALHTAATAGIQVGNVAEALKDAGAFIESITEGTYYLTGYRSRPPHGWQGATSSRLAGQPETHVSTHAPTAMATECRVLLGHPLDHAKVGAASVALCSMLPVWDKGGDPKKGGKARLSQLDFYYWHHASMALFLVGGDAWRKWNVALRDALLRNQVRVGHASGSWDPIDAWGTAGGRVYATAINTLTLEIYYRYPRAGIRVVSDTVIADAVNAGRAQLLLDRGRADRAAGKPLDAYRRLRAAAEQYPRTPAGQEAAKEAAQLLTDPQVGARMREETEDRECEVWLKAARNYQRNQMKDKAREAVQRLLAKYPRSRHAAEARKILEELGDR